MKWLIAFVVSWIVFLICVGFIVEEATSAPDKRPGFTLREVCTRSADRLPPDNTYEDRQKHIRKCIRRLKRSMGSGSASAYGPGLYGNRTACVHHRTKKPITLRRGTLGVASLEFPCGANVTVCHRGRCAVLRVIDKGPFVHGRKLDITEGATRRFWGVNATQWGVRTVKYKRGSIWNRRG